MRYVFFSDFYNQNGTFSVLGDDAGFHVSRIQSLYEGMKTGEFPVYMYSYQSNGYGYPLGITYPDIFLYPFAALMFLGLNLQTVVKLFIIFFCLLIVILSFCAARMLTKNYWLCLTFCIVYSIAPYHLISNYDRFAIGEILASAFLPLVISSVICIFTEKKPFNFKNIAILSVSYSCIIYSHVLTSSILFVLLAIACLIAIIYKAIKKSGVVEIIKTIAICGLIILLICAAYIVPFLDYYVSYDFLIQNDVEERTNFITHWSPSQIFLIEMIAPLIIHFSQSDQIRFFIGLPIVASIVIWAVLIIRNLAHKNKLNNKHIVGIFLFFLFLFCIWVASHIFPWQIALMNIPLISFLIGFIENIEFAFRILSYATLFGCFLGLLALWEFETISIKWTKIIGISMVVVSVIVALFYGIGFLNDNHSAFKIDPENNIWTDKLYCPKDFVENSDEQQIDTFINYEKDKNIELKTSDNNLLNVCEASQIGSTIYANLENKSDNEILVEFPYINYPYVIAKDNNNENLEICQTNNALVQVRVPAKYSGQITVGFCAPRYWHVAEIVSIVTVLCLIIIGIVAKKRKSADITVVKLLDSDC